MNSDLGRLNSIPRQPDNNMPGCADKQQMFGTNEREEETGEWLIDSW